jgi:uncharacterized protein (TIGR03067 family)
MDLPVDATKTPKEIDIQLGGGSQKGQTRQGIYLLVGDALIVCLHPPGRGRPGQSLTKPKSGAVILAFQKGWFR